MKPADIATKKDADLRKSLAELREQIRASKTGVGSEDASINRTEVRKTIARIQTELSTRARAAKSEK